MLLLASPLGFTVSAISDVKGSETTWFMFSVACRTQLMHLEWHWIEPGGMVG
jgi:hypothetical protein